MRCTDKLERLKRSHQIAELFDTRIPYFRGSRRLQMFLTTRISPRPTCPCIVDIRRGIKIELTGITDDIDRNLYYNGTYEPAALHLLQVCLREGDCMVDVGTNIGVFALTAGTLVGAQGTVLAFEPMPSTFEMLKRNIAINNLENVFAYDIGIGDKQGMQSITLPTQHNRGQATFRPVDGFSVSNTQAPTDTLDSVLEALGIQHVRLLKIDVEGWESQVLAGANNLLSGSRGPIICIEYNTAISGHELILSRIQSVNQYKIFVTAHGNGHVSKLVPFESFADLPNRVSFNLYCFLDHHLATISGECFA